MSVSLFLFCKQVHLYHIFIFYFLIFIYLAALGLSCGTRDLRCGMQDLLLRCMGFSLWRVGFSLVVACGLSSCGVWAPERTGSVVEARGLSSCGTQAPEYASSVVAARGFSCPAACGILVLRQGIEPASPAWEGGFLTTGPPGKSLYHIFRFHI